MSFWSKLFGRENKRTLLTRESEIEKREFFSPEKACMTTAEPDKDVTDNEDKPIGRPHNVRLEQISQMTEDEKIRQEKRDVLWNLERIPLTELVRHPHKAVVHSGEQWYEKMGADGKAINLNERLTLFKDHEKNTAKSVSLLNRMVSGCISNTKEIDFIENEEQLPEDLFDQAKQYFKVIASRLVNHCDDNVNDTKGEVRRRNALRVTLEEIDSHKHNFRFEIVSNATLNEWGLERSAIAPERAWEQGRDGVFKYIIYLSHSLFALRGNINPISFLYDINLRLRLGIFAIAQEKLKHEILFSDRYKWGGGTVIGQLSKALEYTLRDLREFSDQEGCKRIIDAAFLADVRDNSLGNAKERADISGRLALKVRNRETVRRQTQIGKRAGLRPIDKDMTTWDQRFYIRYMILKKKNIELQLNRLKAGIESYQDTEIHCLSQKALEQVVGEEAGYWNPGLTSYASEYKKEGEKWKIYMRYEIGARRLQLLISQYTRICNYRYESEHPGGMEKFLEEVNRIGYGSEDLALKQAYGRGIAGVKYRDLSGAAFSLSEFAQYGIDVTKFLSALHDRMLLSKIFADSEKKQIAVKQLREILRKQKDNITDTDLFRIYEMMKKLEMSPFGVASELVSSLAPFVMVSEFGEYLTYHVYRETNDNLTYLLGVLKANGQDRQDIKGLIRRHFINVGLVKTESKRFL